MFVGGRDELKAPRLATRIGGGAGHGTLHAAADFGEVVLVALPYGAGADVVKELQAALSGKVLLDCANPVGPGFRLLTEGGPSAAGRLAAAAPGAQVVKAFNLCHEDVWRMTPPLFDGQPLAVPVCGDDEAALTRVYELVRDMGCAPVPVAGWNAPDCWRRQRRCTSDCGWMSRRTYGRSHRRWHTRQVHEPRACEVYRGLRQGFCGAPRVGALPVVVNIYGDVGGKQSSHPLQGLCSERGRAE